MPDFQHGSIRQAMATLQSIDFDAMRAETALALEQAKAAMDAAEEADREQLEAEEAEFGDVRGMRGRRPKTLLTRRKMF